MVRTNLGVTKPIFNDIGIHEMNDHYLKSGFYIECEDGQAATIGRDEVNDH